MDCATERPRFTPDDVSGVSREESRRRHARIQADFSFLIPANFCVATIRAEVECS